MRIAARCLCFHPRERAFCVDDFPAFGRVSAATSGRRAHLRTEASEFESGSSRRWNNSRDIPPSWIKFSFQRLAQITRSRTRLDASYLALVSNKNRPATALLPLLEGVESRDISGVKVELDGNKVREHPTQHVRSVSACTGSGHRELNGFVSKLAIATCCMEIRKSQAAVTRSASRSGLGPV